jgi:hypothetical protein
MCGQAEGGGGRRSDVLCRDHYEYPRLPLGAKMDCARAHENLKIHALRRVKDPQYLDDRDRFTLAYKQKRSKVWYQNYVSSLRGRQTCIDVEAEDVRALT